MEISFKLKDLRLAGEPREYDPRLLVWSTDRPFMDDATPGMAAATVPLDEKQHGCYKIRLDGPLPVHRDVHSDLCIALYTSTRETGYSEKLAPRDRPNTIRAGQINLHWLGLLHHMAESKAEKLRVEAPLLSLAAYEGILYHSHFERDDEDPSFISAQAEAHATRATIEISIVPRSGEHLAQIRDIPKNANFTGALVEGDLQDAAYERNLDAYTETYYRLFPRDGSGELHYPTPSGNVVVFKPDTPSMERFHIPTWSTGTDRVPFAEWWLVTMNQPHDSNSSTEAFLQHLAGAGIARAQTTAEDLIRTVEEAFGRDTPIEKRLKYSQMGTTERNMLLRAIEATYYSCSAFALAFHYTSDGRYVVSDHWTIERVSAEDPEQDIASGASRSGDCEDLEKIIAICVHILSRGRRGNNQEDWTSKLLSKMRQITQHYLTINTFGSVRGAQLSDANEDSQSRLGKIDAQAGVRFGRELRKRSDLPAWEADLERLNRRVFWMNRFKEERPRHWVIWQYFLRAHPNLEAILAKLLPTRDDDILWRNMVMWIDHYISTRLHLVIEHIEAREGINVIFQSDDTLRVIDGEMDELFSQEDFERRYNNGQKLEFSWALEPGRLDNELGFGADVWAGQHDRYRLFFRMQHIFPLANLVLTWALRWDLGKDEPGPVQLTAVRSGDVVVFAATDDWITDHFKKMVDDIRLYGPPDEEPERVTIMEHMHTATPTPALLSGRHYVVYDSNHDSKRARSRVSKEAALFIESYASIAELRVNLSDAMRREARNRPRSFWEYAIGTYYPQWHERFTRLFAALTANDFDDDVMRHIAAREDQIGAYRMWRNGAMWLEWFHEKLEKPGYTARALVLDIFQPEKHGTIDAIFDEEEATDFIVLDRRKEAKRIAKALIDTMAVSNNLALTLDAAYMRHVHRHVILALGALAVAPVVMRNDREKTLLAVSERIHYRFARREPVLMDSAQHEQRDRDGLKDTKSLANLAAGDYSEMTPLLAYVLQDMQTHSPMTRGLVANMRGWISLYVPAKMEFLVRRLRRAGGSDVYMERENRIVIRKEDTTLTRREFLQRFYHSSNVASVSLSPVEQLQFYSRLRQVEPEGAEILIGLDRMMTLRSVNSSGNLSGVGAILARNIASEVRDFNPRQHRASHFLVTVADKRTAHETTSGKLAGETLSITDLLAIDDVARLPAAEMWPVIRGNRYLVELEAAHPFRFWSRVIKTRFPELHAQARMAFGPNVIAAHGLPEEDDVAWRNLLPWLTYYFKELFENHIEDAGVGAQFAHADFNVIYDKVNNRRLTYVDYLDRLPGRPTLRDTLQVGLFLNPYGYDEDTSARLSILNEIVRDIYSSETERHANRHQFRRAMIYAGNLLLRDAIPPPGSGPLKSIVTVGAASVSSSASHTETHLEHDKMLIDNRADHEMAIGGHMFAIFMPTIQQDKAYRTHADLMDELCGADGPHKTLSLHVRRRIQTMVGPTASAEAFRAAELLWESLPVLVGEGTGPQELMLRPLGDYFGPSEELLQRTATHIVSSDLMRIWENTKSENSEDLTVNLYGFQTHLFSGSMVSKDHLSGKTYERRLSNFYRRVGHSCSYDLHEIDSRFGHLLWVRPQNMHFGANLRHVVECSDALAIPAPPSLAASYRGDATSKAALIRRGRHVIPYRFRFESHQSSSVKSNRSISHDDTDLPFHSDTHLLAAQKTPMPVTFSVDSDSPLAETIRNISKDPNATSLSLDARGSIYVSEPRDSEIDLITKALTQQVGSHTLSKEKFAPSAPLLVRIECERPVVFTITDA